MFAVYATKGDFNNPLSSFAKGEMPEPKIKERWVRVKMTHVSLNRHDVFTLQGLSGQEEPIRFPMILGNDGAGLLDDGTPVAIYPVMNDPEYRGDEMLDPKWHVFSELVPGTMAEYVAVPKRNAIPMPQGMKPEHAASMGTAWLTAYSALFTKSNLKAGQRMLVQGAGGGMSTAFIQMGLAAGFDVWVTCRSEGAKEVCKKLGVKHIYGINEKLPVLVHAAFDNVGAFTLQHSLDSVVRGGTVVSLGVTTGLEAKINLLNVFIREIKIVGSVMGTREEFMQLLSFVQEKGILPETGKIVPASEAYDAFKEMIEGKTKGKTVFTF